MAQIQPPTNNYITQGKHGSYNAIDYAARTSKLIPYFNRKEIYAVEDGTITKLGWHATMGNRLELTSADDNRQYGHGHLAEYRVKVGQKVKRGQLIGIMGYTGYTIPSGFWGTHLHLVCLNKKTGKYVYPPTLYNAPFRIYTPITLPKVGSLIKLIPTDKRTTFKAGTTTRAGVISVTDNTYVYVVRGHDPHFPNRILINSKEGGGNGVALALYYTNGQRIAGWKQL